MPSWCGDALDPGSRLGIETKSDIKDLLIWCARKGASDIIFQAGQPVLVSLDGELKSVTRQWMQSEDMRRVANALAGSESIVARLYAGNDVDVAVEYEVADELDDGGFPVTYRFRANMTAGYYDSGLGMQIVLRYIKWRPPRPEDIDLEPEILAEATPAQGAVILAGETGSGKTTTTAALKRYILEGRSSLRGIILTYEAPIEFLFGNIPSSCCTIAQQEIPKHLPTFAAGVRNALRRNPCLIEIQEMRDMETIMAAVEAANTGHAVYATAHANSVAHTLRRLTQMFPTDQQGPAFYDVLWSTHLIVSQVLVPKLGGGRVCLREWQVLTPELKRMLEAAGPGRAFEALQSEIRKGEAGRAMIETVRLKCEAGLLSTETAVRVLRRYGYRAEADALARTAPDNEPAGGVASHETHLSEHAPCDASRRTSLFQQTVPSSAPVSDF